MKKLIILVVLILVGYKIYEYHQSQEGEKPFGVYQKFVDCILSGQHEKSLQFIDGDKAKAQLKEQKDHYHVLDGLGTLGTVQKTDCKLTDEQYSDGGNTVTIKMYQVIAGGTGTSNTVRNLEYIERIHDVVMVKTPNGWKITDFHFSLAKPLEGNRLDWTGMI